MFDGTSMDEFSWFCEFSNFELLTEVLKFHVMQRALPTSVWSIQHFFKRVNFEISIYKVLTGHFVLNKWKTSSTETANPPQWKERKMCNIGFKMQVMPRLAHSKFVLHMGFDPKPRIPPYMCRWTKICSAVNLLSQTKWPEDDYLRWTEQRGQVCWALL